MRIAIRYARSGPARYISHLDMQRAFGRAIRRARIRALYSQGFNPHLLMSFASPLSVGYATKSDYLELRAEDGTDLGEAEQALSASCPPGIQIVGMYEMPEKSKKLMALNDSASYEISFSGADNAALERAVNTLAGEETHVCEDRKGKQVDLAPLVREMSFDEGVLTALLANSSGSSLNPASLAAELLRMAKTESDYEICRLECYGKAEGKATPFFAMFGG